MHWLFLRDKADVAQLRYTQRNSSKPMLKMSTTTIRIPNELKARLSQVAENLDSTPHALIIDAIAQRVEAEERRDTFYKVAEQRFANIAESGKAIPWDAMKSFLKARVAGQDIKPPKAKKLSR